MRKASMRHVGRLTLVVLSLLISLSPFPANAAARDVTIVDFDYQPAYVGVPLGTTVIWTNVGDIPHVTISNTVNPSNPDGTPGVGWWDSDYIVPGGGQFQWVFSAAGTFPYHGEIPDMRGAVVVPLRVREVEPGALYRVIWATAQPTEPDLIFLIQKKDPGPGEVFADWKASSTRLGARFRPGGPGTYQFRARLARFGGGVIVGSNMYSPVVSVSVP
jgi:plastocyanin